MAAQPVPTTPPEPAGAAPDASGGADSRLLALADQCVMCGLCLPHCPTYRISLDEAESPRGRIALGRSIATGRIAPEPSALAHLDQCLDCLSCQKVCPSGVRYGEIITQTRAMPAVRRPRRGLDALLTDPNRLTRLARIGAAVRAGRWLPRLTRALPAGSRWRRLAERVPDAPDLLSMRPARKAATRGAVTLFRGCVASVYDRDTHASARTLLEALGYDVRVPAGTPCCGALARHAGDVERADDESRATRDAIAASGAATVLVSASGCFGDLRDHASAGVDVVDIAAFIARDPALGTLRFRPLAKRAALHLPCTQVNVVGAIASIRALLARIPSLDVVDVAEQPRCCGAAGNYFIEHPDIADRLRDEKLAQVHATTPDLLLTTNVGCRIHFGNGLRDAKRALPVLHPVTLLAQQLDTEMP
jgi:glycolate oxidase iron-sulfur subunit